MLRHLIAPLLMAVSAAAAAAAAGAADELKLRPGISFSQDLDAGFPIVAEKIDDLDLEQGRPTFIFFGASGDLNTNRQARRVVDLYRHNRATALKFIVMDVDHATSAPARQLVRQYYGNYIPFEVVLDGSGKKVWSHEGEVDQRVLQLQIDKVLSPGQEGTETGHHI